MMGSNEAIRFMREVTSLYNGARLRRLRTDVALVIAPWLKAPLEAMWYPTTNGTSATNATYSTHRTDT